MADATERLVNLALYLADARGPLSADRVRSEVDGYPSGQDDAAFIRMFERDKDELRAMGLCISSDNEGAYHLDTSATFAAEIELSPQEAATVRVVGHALLEDPAFPFAEELRFALAKIATAISQTDIPVVARTADERPAAQGAAVSELERAAASRKRVEFDYVNSFGDSKHHSVEPYGLFLRDGRWYLVGRDVDRDEPRTYAVTRLDALTVETARPKTQDFERPEDFDIARFIRLPFQYGTAEFSAQIDFDAETGWRAEGLSGGVGSLESRADGTVIWNVLAHDPAKLMRWVIENGPGITIASPAHLTAELRRSLVTVTDLHNVPIEGDA